ncbi:NAD(+)--dinitrogen-reductase ADP-D-ribosyltransferase [Sulfuriferula sp. GW1]|uniref:NAD(+)--dinitrogen-reductase ADP-D-ribosyltransferase n=1 Tax=Sulfuriferula sp. GW1 TaxID=3345111 RepID=UPI0039AF5A60
MTVAALRGHSANLVGVPTGLLASAAFNDHPLPLHIRGVHESHARLFDLLNTVGSHAEAGNCFQGYMDETFNLSPKKPKKTQPGDAPVRRFRASYLRLLKGWGYDSNSREGAVMKGWAESRFGLFPTFHKAALARFASGAWLRYVEEKLSSRFHNNDIHTQLDLLYEFCQWSIGRWFQPGRHHVTLYRGVNDFREDNLLCGQSRPRTGPALVRLNNIVSFTAHRNIACEFGDSILEAHVPTAKILFFNDLLSRHALKGEAEYLVIGGDYRVTVNYL